MIGDPSDSKRSLYSRPVSSVAEQTTLETWPAAKLPSCTHRPEEATATGTGRPSSPSQEIGRSFRPTIRSSYSTTRRRTSPSMAATSAMSALQAGILSQQLIGPTASGLRWKSIHMGGPCAVFAFSQTADGLCSLKTGRSPLGSALL